MLLSVAYSLDLNNVLLLSNTNKKECSYIYNKINTLSPINRIF